jgi:restriction system protein
MELWDKNMASVPTYDELINPALQALHLLGGSGTIDEIYTKVTEISAFTPEQLNMLHDSEKGSQTQIEYRLAWARTYLKKYGLIENSGRGVWALTAEGQSTQHIDGALVARSVRRSFLPQAKVKTSPPDALESEVIDNWRDILLTVLLNMQPDAFERLIQRILRESGFIQVQVTGRTGDGGIDGKGIMRIGGLMSFHVIFQCKRYQGSVSASHIRDFRGAMVGRADKGLFVTTGNFTKDAIQEATRDGAPAIDLLDGDRLLDKLKELGLGVKSQMIEQVIVDEAWFISI